MKRSRFMLIALLALLYTSCSKKDGQYDASGTFEATEVMVSSEVAGRILAFDIREGQVLIANQQVGYIDSLQLSLRKKQLESSIKAVASRRPEVQTQIAVIQQQIATAKTEKQRVENLVAANAANQKQLDDINASIALLEKQLAAQQSTLTSSSQGISDEISTLQVQIEQIEDQLSKSRIINPIDGTVLVKYSEVNELAAPGKPLYKVADMENMIFRAYITSDQLTKVKLGQTLKIYADFGEDRREYDGVVEWISSKSEFTPKTIQTKDERANLVYAIKLAVKNDDYLKIGMYGELKLQNEE